EFVGGTRLVPRVLRAQARELREAPVDHERGALGGCRQQRREGGERQRPGADEPDAGRARVHGVVAHTRTPALLELVDALDVPAGLRAAVAVREILPAEI